MKFPVTLKRVEAAKPTLVEVGFPISGNPGAIEFEVCLTGYSLARTTLIIEVLVKPRFVPIMEVKTTMRSAWATEWISEVG